MLRPQHSQHPQLDLVWLSIQLIDDDAILLSREGDLAQPFLVYFFLLDFLLYGAIIATVHAVAFHKDTVSRAALDAQLRADATTARLEALRVQLMPHFLFNTLNGIATLMHPRCTSAVTSGRR